MLVDPASVDQVRRGMDGRMVLIDKDVGGVADDLARIDPHLKVRFAERGPAWIVFWESDDKRETHLVLSAKAWQNDHGIWEGLDHRIVKRVREIDGHSRGGHDFAAEVEKANRIAEQGKHDRVKARIAAHGEELAHAIRKDLGERYKGRTFVPKDLPAA